MPAPATILLAVLTLSAWAWTGWTAWLVCTEPDMRWGGASERRRERDQRTPFSPVTRLFLVSFTGGIAWALTVALFQLDFPVDGLCMYLFLSVVGVRFLKLFDVLWELGITLWRVRGALARDEPERALASLASPDQ